MPGALLGLSLAAGSGSSAPPRARVILVGWDGADWGLLDPLLREGKLPHLTRLVARGRTYDLATFEPMASPLIWTTIATGRTPVDHGVALPRSVRTKRALGDALFEAKDCAGAETAFADAVAREEGDVMSRNGLGLSLFCQGRLAEARRELSRSLALKPDQPEIRSALAMIDAASGAPRR